MNENNNMNQNVVPEVPVQPVGETPVAPVPETQPMPAAPSMDPNAQFSTQPTEQPSVQPAVQPAVQVGVPPVPPAPVQQPVGQPVGMSGEMQPQKKNNLPFILIVILLIAVIGGLVGFLIFKNVKDSDSGDRKDRVQEKEKKDSKKDEDDGDGDKPKEIANADKITVGEYDMKIPQGYTLNTYESGMAILVDSVNKVQLTMNEVQGMNITVVEQNVEQIKSAIAQEGGEVGTPGSGDIGGVKWFALPYKLNGNVYIYMATNLNTDLLELYIYNAGSKEYKDIVLGVNEVLSTASKNGSSYAGKKEVYNHSKLKLFNDTAFK